MSLKDPDLRTRGTSTSTSGARLARSLLIWLPLTVAADVAVASFLFGSGAGAFRYMAVFDLAELQTDGSISDVFFAFAIPLSVLFGVNLIYRLSPLLGIVSAIFLRAAVFTGVATALFPTLAANWMPLDAPAVLPARDDWYGRAWATLDEWGLPALAGVTLLFILIAVVTAFTARSRVHSRAEFAQTGAVATGTVTAVQQMGRQTQTEEVFVRLTVSFRDQEGRTRWARTGGFIREEDRPKEGDTLRMRYDSRRPGNTRVMTFDVPWTRSTAARFTA